MEKRLTKDLTHKNKYNGKRVKINIKANRTKVDIKTIYTRKNAKW